MHKVDLRTVHLPNHPHLSPPYNIEGINFIFAAPLYASGLVSSQSLPPNAEALEHISISIDIISIRIVHHSQNLLHKVLQEHNHGSVEHSESSQSVKPVSIIICSIGTVFWVRNIASSIIKTSKSSQSGSSQSVK